jgi:hypothetical protein
MEESWKLYKKQFQDDLMMLDMTELPFGAFFVRSTTNGPSSITSDVLMERLENNHKELTAHAAKLLALPEASATIS